jgi:diacylglycerol kinase
VAHRTVLSFKYAFDGIWTAFKEEPNLKIHFLIGLLVLLLGFLFKLSAGEWVAVCLTIGLVISVELTNTAIETVIDSFTTDQHPGAKKAKDVSAGAVLVISLMAVAVGVLIFLPYFSAFLGHS